MKEAELARLLGRRIRELRQRKGITAERLAWDCDLSKSFVSMIENGHRFPTMAILLRFSKLLRVNMRDFFDFGQRDP